jgi:hypothetical protein
MSEINKSIRIRTTPGGDDKHISVKLEQNFDFLEVLSLKISQEDLYTSFCANYGVVVGRVIANKGFGIPNAKISVFIPITDEDEKNDLIRDIYPYKTVTDKNKDGVRYNLLLSESTCSLNVPVGTFPTKEELLNNDIVLEVFDKYYKFTTKTNDSGDYMLFGIPTGNKIIHMDVDLSDINFLSIRPYDLIGQGASEKFFESGVKFRSSTNLDTLLQIKSDNQSVDVIPFWGDPESCEIGITRLDFDIPDDITPNCVFTGSIFTDSDENALKRNCNIKKNLGDISQLKTGPGVVDILKLNIDPVTNNGVNIESLESKPIDDDGVFLFTLPMYYDKVVTNEQGVIVRSTDPNVGVPTKGKYRFKIKFNDQSTIINRNGRKSVSTASLIVPSTDFFVRFTEEITDYDNVGTHFHTFEWKQVYTTTQYVRKLKRKKQQRWGYIGLKNIKFIMTPVNDESDDSDEDETTSSNLNPPYSTIIRRTGGAFSKRKKFGLSFHDAWLNGSCYLFKFEIKRKNNGNLDCCAREGWENLGTQTAEFVWEDDSTYTINRRSGNFQNRCTVFVPVDLSIPNNTTTGSDDTGEPVYCRFALNTKIINIGSMDMCEGVLESLEKSLSNNINDPIVNFGGKLVNGSVDCLGTNIERGIRTNILIDDLPPSTYRDINELLPYHLDIVNDWGTSTNLFGSDAWHDNDNDTYLARELKQGYGRDYVNYYCRLDYNGPNGDEQGSFTPKVGPYEEGINLTVLDPTLNNNFGCSTASASWFYRISQRDKVYFYFGIVPGKTAIEKLKQQFFLN